MSDHAHHEANGADRTAAEYRKIVAALESEVSRLRAELARLGPAGAAAARPTRPNRTKPEPGRNPGEVMPVRATDRVSIDEQIKRDRARTFEEI